SALVLPAVKKSRGPPARTKCSNTLKQLGRALHNSHDHFQPSPASGWTTVGPGNPAGKFVGWRPLILPFIEQGNLQVRYDFTRNWWEPPNLTTASFPVPTFVCPSVPRRETVTGAVAKPPRPALSGIDPPLAPTDYEAMMGVQPCIDPVLYATQPGNRSVMHRNSTVTMVQILDGTSNTMMVVECVARPLVYFGRTAFGATNDQGICWADSE